MKCEKKSNNKTIIDIKCLTLIAKKYIDSKTAANNFPPEKM